MALNSLQFPVANQEVAKRKADALDFQARQLIKNTTLTPGQTIGQVSQQMGEQQTQALGQIGLENQAQNLQDANKMAQLELDRQRNTQQLSTATQGLALDQAQDNYANTLYQLNDSAANRELQDRLDFQNYGAQQEFWSDSAYSDYAATHARDIQQYNDWKQAAEQAYERHDQLVESAYQKMDQQLRNEYERASAARKNQIQTELNQLKAAADAANQRAANRAKNRQAQWTAGGQILGATAGAVAGGLLAGPGGATAGATLGASIGSNLGGGVGSLAETYYSRGK
jgi:hypothetical protein